MKIQIKSLSGSVLQKGRRPPVRPTKPFDENWMEECSSGIHFMITKIEAENY